MSILTDVTAALILPQIMRQTLEIEKGSIIYNETFDLVLGLYQGEPTPSSFDVRRAHHYAPMPHLDVFPEPDVDIHFIMSSAEAYDTYERNW